MTLSRNDIIGYRPPVERVDAFGGEVYVRSLTGAEQASLRKFNQANPDDEMGMMARVIVATTCDAGGAAILTDDDVPTVASLPLGEVMKLVSTAYRMSGIEIGEVDRIKKK